MFEALVLIFLAAVAASAFLWRGVAIKQSRQAKLAPKPIQRNPFHCVEIRSGPTACEAVRQIGKTRFLSDEAPSLPLAGCTNQNCTCSYAHFDDRREHDRRNPYGMWAGIPPELTGERRLRPDRRKSPASTFKPSIAP